MEQTEKRDELDTKIQQERKTHLSSSSKLKEDFNELSTKLASVQKTVLGHEKVCCCLLLQLISVLLLAKVLLS